MEAHAILDRLLDDASDVFDRADAARLVGLIPAERRSRWWPTFEFLGRWSGGATRGAAAGVGDVSLEDGEQAVEFTAGGDVLWRIGGYKVTHRHGILTITQMMREDDGPECHLRYRGQADPHVLEIVVDRAVRFGPVTFTVGLPQVWKRPATAR
ncbi:hypothetical protein [Caenispirillum salinarum]|uniref:hypothetical protein n=1 Tax=Caenispirillum salinarum TaxID=859058 RepID=UPI00384CE4BA